MDEVTQGHPSLAQAVEQFDLAGHPLMADFKDGNVSLPAMAALARALSELLALLPRAWEQVNDFEAGEVASMDVMLWHDFAAYMADRANVDPLPEEQDLVALTRQLLLKEHTTLGALYALRSQIPKLASRMLSAVEAHWPGLLELVLPLCQHIQQSNVLTGRALTYLSQRSAHYQQGGIEAGVKEAEALWNLLSGIQRIAAQPA